VQQALLGATREWAAGAEPGPEVAAARRRAIGLCHERYVAGVPVYRRLAESVGAPPGADVEFIADNLLLVDVFKSYDPAWLAAGDIDRMTEWLRTISTWPGELSLTGVTGVAAWWDRLGRRAGNGRLGRARRAPAPRVRGVPRNRGPVTGGTGGNRGRHASRSRRSLDRRIDAAQLEARTVFPCGPCVVWACVPSPWPE